MTDAADMQSARIRQLEDERYQAMLDGDVEALDRLLSFRLNYTHSNGSRDSKDSYLRKVRDGYFACRSVEHPVHRRGAPPAATAWGIAPPAAACVDRGSA